MSNDRAAVRLIQMHPKDNVAVVATPGGLPAGAQPAGGPVLVEAVPEGHKVALETIAQGGEVRRYDVVIGHATCDLVPGAWVNEAKLALPEPPSMKTLPVSTRAAPVLRKPDRRTFEGYRNPDGSVGTRNLLGITSTVQCVSGIVACAVARIRADLLPKYPNVDGVLALDHTYGCGVAIDAPGAEIPIRTLRNIAANPNLGGEVMTVSLGCEKLQPSRLFPDLDLPGLVRLQDREHVGFQAMVADIMATAEHHLQRLNERRRETAPLAELVLGMQCGGSDALSGVTANPALGIASDMLVAAGGTSLFSEVSEVRDAIDQLTARAASAEVADDLVDWLSWYDAYLARGGVDRSANTTPGNKAGGLSNITEKAMGSIIKSGTAPILGVVPPGDRARRKGLLFAATPASDFICGTLQLAAGATVHVFTTGRGTPYSLEAMPTLKVSTRSDLAHRWHDLIDLDAGAVAQGTSSLEEMGQRVFDRIIATASGERTCAERNGAHNALALFNPAPVT